MEELNAVVPNVVIAGDNVGTGRARRRSDARHPERRHVHRRHLAGQRTTACCCASSSTSTASKCCAARKARSTAATRRAAPSASARSARPREFGVRRRHRRSARSTGATSRRRSICRSPKNSARASRSATTIATATSRARRRAKDRRLRRRSRSRRLRLGTDRPRERAVQRAERQDRHRVRRACKPASSPPDRLELGLPSRSRSSLRHRERRPMELQLRLLQASRAAGSASGNRRPRSPCLSRQWLEQQSVDLNVDITDNIGFQYLFGNTSIDAALTTTGTSGEFNFYIDYFNNETEVTSHEFQFSGGNDRFNWVGGAYFWDQSNRSRNPAWSMREWSDVPTYGDPQPFSYVNQVLTNPACQATPAQRGITTWAPHVAAAYVAPTALALDVNSVNGWPFPCNATLGPNGYNVNTGWVAALAAGDGHRPATGSAARRSTDGPCSARSPSASDGSVRPHRRLPLSRSRAGSVHVRRGGRHRSGHHRGEAERDQPRVGLGRRLRRHSDSRQHGHRRVRRRHDSYVVELAVHATT